MAAKEEKLEKLSAIVERRKKHYESRKSADGASPEELRRVRRLLKRAQRRRLKLMRGKKLSRKDKEGS